MPVEFFMSILFYQGGAVAEQCPQFGCRPVFPLSRHAQTGSVSYSTEAFVPPLDQPDYRIGFWASEDG